jgi:hypothetical protein
MAMDRPLQSMEPSSNKPHVFYQQPFNYMSPFNVDSGKLMNPTPPYNHYQVTLLEQQCGAVGGYVLENGENVNQQWNLSQQNIQAGNSNFLGAGSGYPTPVHGSNGYIFPPHQPQQAQNPPQRHHQQQLPLSMDHLQAIDKENNPPAEYHTSELCEDLIALDGNML